jgi:hypothetical protein
VKTPKGILVETLGDLLKAFEKLNAQLSKGKMEHTIFSSREYCESFRFLISEKRRLCLYSQNESRGNVSQTVNYACHIILEGKPGFHVKEGASP